MIGTSTGEQYEDDFSYQIGETTDAVDGNKVPKEEEIPITTTMNPYPDINTEEEIPEVAQETQGPAVPFINPSQVPFLQPQNVGIVETDERDPAVDYGTGPHDDLPEPAPRIRDIVGKPKTLRGRMDELPSVDVYKAIGNLFTDIDGKPRFQTWPERLVRSLLGDAGDAIQLTGEVLDGTVDLNDPKNKDRIASLALLGILGMRPIKTALTATPREISAFEMRILDQYTSSMYLNMNKYLSGQTAITGAWVKPLVNKLDKVFEKAPPVPSNVVVYRGVPGEGFLKRTPFLQVGDELSWPVFTSTSFNKRVGMDFANLKDTKPFRQQMGILFEIVVPKSSKAIDINRTSVNPLFYHEKELLLPRNSKFEVIGMDRDTRTIQLKLLDGEHKKVTSQTVQDIVNAQLALQKPAKKIPITESGQASKPLPNVSDDAVEKALNDIMKALSNAPASMKAY